MGKGAVYTRQEVADLRVAQASGRPLMCPRCGTRLALARHVTPTPAVSYVRRRNWWKCPECGRSAVLES